MKLRNTSAIGVILCGTDAFNMDSPDLLGKLNRITSTSMLERPISGDNTVDDVFNNRQLDKIEIFLEKAKSNFYSNVNEFEQLKKQHENYSFVDACADPPCIISSFVELDSLYLAPVNDPLLSEQAHSLFTEVGKKRRRKRKRKNKKNRKNKKKKSNDDKKKSNNSDDPVKNVGNMAMDVVGGLAQGVATSFLGPIGGKIVGGFFSSIKKSFFGFAELENLQKKGFLSKEQINHYKSWLQTHSSDNKSSLLEQLNSNDRRSQKHNLENTAPIDGKETSFVNAEISNKKKSNKSFFQQIRDEAKPYTNGENIDDTTTDEEEKTDQTSFVNNKFGEKDDPFAFIHSESETREFSIPFGPGNIYKINGQPWYNFNQLTSFRDMD